MFGEPGGMTLDVRGSAKAGRFLRISQGMSGEPGGCLGDFDDCKSKEILRNHKKPELSKPISNKTRSAYLWRRLTPIGTPIRRLSHMRWTIGVPMAALLTDWRTTDSVWDSRDDYRKLEEVYGNCRKLKQFHSWVKQFLKIAISILVATCAAH